MKTKIRYHQDIQAKTNLHVAFGDIKRCDTGVGHPTSKHTTEQAFAIIVKVVGDGAKISAQSLVSGLSGVR